MARSYRAVSARSEPPDAGACLYSLIFRYSVRVLIPSICEARSRLPPTSRSVFSTSARSTCPSGSPDRCASTSGPPLCRPDVRGYDGRRDHGLGGKEHHRLDGVLELADVAGPGVTAEDLEGCGRQRPAGLAVTACRLGQEVLGQPREVGQALPQRRQIDLDHAEAEAQIVAEGAFPDHGVEVAVRRGDDPHVHLDGLVRADPDDLARLQRAQQVGLGGEGHVADLVEEERASVRRLETPLAAVHGPGERPLLVAEQLALEHPLRERRAVERDEGAVPAGPRAVERLGDQFLARAALAADEDGGVRVDDLVHHIEDALHRLASAEDAGKREGLVDGGLELEVVALQADALAGGTNRLPEHAEIDGLLEVVERSALHRLDGALHRAVARHDDALGDGPGLPSQRPASSDDLQPVQVLESQVRDDEVGTLPLQPVQGVPPRVDHVHAVALLLEHVRHDLRVADVVLDDQDRQRIGLRGYRHDPDILSPLQGQVVRIPGRLPLPEAGPPGGAGARSWFPCRAPSRRRGSRRAPRRRGGPWGAPARCRSACG